MLEEHGDISEDFEFKDDNGDEKIGGIDLINMHVHMIVGNEIEEELSCD